MSNPSFIQHVEQQAMLKAECVFKRHPRWLVKSEDKALFHFERMSGMRYPVGKRPEVFYEAWTARVKQQPFWELSRTFEWDGNPSMETLPSGLQIKWSSLKNFRDDFFLILDTSQDVAWLHTHMDLTPAQAEVELKKTILNGLERWHLPKKDDMRKFHGASGNPALSGGFRRLYGQSYWVCAEGRMNFDRLNPDVDSQYAGNVMGYHPMPKSDPLAFWAIMRGQGMSLAHRVSGELLGIPDFDVHADQAWKGLDFGRLWGLMMGEGLRFEAEGHPEVVIDPATQVQEGLLNMDHTPCRLPRFEASQLTDVNKGLWELHGQDAAQLVQLNLRPRDPAMDVREEWVAIDFGTSSTVVAVATPSGGKELLRVGARDFNARVETKHYENPTVLEFLDLAAFLNIWNQQVYRPALDWDWVKAAHEALEDFRNDARNPRTVNSVMLYLKRWVLESERVKSRLIDQRHGFEYELAPLEELHPVRGQALRPRGEATLDVIELYAWYLGMAINTRSRGLHLKYAMTFPVKYTQEVRNKILAAFSRGLQRSLPATLALNSAVMNEFDVREVATEPMAYAVAVLPTLDVSPTQEGVPYAVFDFGGGTTDFDFGLWRKPTQEELVEDGAEGVFERLGAGGDPYLGGENLLALLAYQVFQDNLTEIYAKKLVFTKPASEPLFPGSEAVVDQSSLAQANTAMLMHELRPLLERPEAYSNKKLTMDMRNREGAEVKTDLKLDINVLQDLIGERVNRGVEGFLSEMKAAFEEDHPDMIHILLAGNASRGRWVREAFMTDDEAWMERTRRYFGDEAPEFVVHFAVGADDAQPYAPNCKTAVALGALDLVPGQAYLQKDRLRAHSQGDAPFRYFVGPVVQSKLQPVLKPGETYHAWHEFGIVREGVFRLAWSSSPRARGGMGIGDGELRVRNINFPGAGKGYRCFGRVVAAGAIELAAAASREAFDTQGAGVTTQLVLDVSG